MSKFQVRERDVTLRQVFEIMLPKAGNPSPAQKAVLMSTALAARLQFQLARILRQLEAANKELMDSRNALLKKLGKPLLRDGKEIDQWFVRDTLLTEKDQADLNAQAKGIYTLETVPVENVQAFEKEMKELLAETVPIGTMDLPAMCRMEPMDLTDSLSFAGIISADGEDLEYKGA